MLRQTRRVKILAALPLLGVIVLLSPTAVLPAAEASAAALVVACDGPATAKSGDEAHRLEPMSLLDPEAIVATGPEGRVTLLFFPDGREYVLGPQSSVRLGKKAVKRLTGTVATPGGDKGAPALPPKPRLNSKRVAGEVLRGDRPYKGFLTPPPNGTTLATRPEFRWVRPGPEVSLRLTLLDGAGKELASREVRGDRVSAAELGVLELQPGQAYTVLLSPAGGGEDPSATFTARFRVLDLDETHLVLQAHREAESERQAGRRAGPAVLKYFFLLDELKLYPEAIELGESLRRELPGNASVLRFLALAYRESGQKELSTQVLQEAAAIGSSARD